MKFSKLMLSSLSLLAFQSQLAQANDILSSEMMHNLASCTPFQEQKNSQFLVWKLIPLIKSSAKPE